MKCLLVCLFLQKKKFFAQEKYSFKTQIGLLTGNTQKAVI